MTKRETLKEIENILDNVDVFSFDNSGDYAYTLGCVISNLIVLKEKLEGDY